MSSVVVLLIACQQSMSKAEFRSWAHEEGNGYFKEKTVGAYTYSVQLLPMELEQNPSGIQKANFQVTIKSKDTKKNMRTDLMDQHGQKVKRYYAFEVEKDIHLEFNDQKIKPVLCHFEQGTDLARDFRLVLAFDKELDEDLVIVIDTKYPAAGRVKMKFNKEDLLKKPKIES